MITSFVHVSYMLVFHQSRCISTTSVYFVLPPHTYPHVLLCICAFFLTMMHA